MEKSSVRSNSISNMNILAQAKNLYDKCGIDMNRDIATYAAHGYVFITPNSFLLGKAVNSKSDVHPKDQWNVEDADAWYVNMAVGDVKDFISKIPVSYTHLTLPTNREV